MESHVVLQFFPTYVVLRHSMGETGFVYVADFPRHTVAWTSDIHQARRFPDIRSVEEFKRENMTFDSWYQLGCAFMTYDSALVTSVMES